LTRRPEIAGIALCLALSAPVSCRKHAATLPRSSSAGDAGPACPTADALASLVSEPGRLTRGDCVVYAPGFFWLGATLSYQATAARQPRLSLIYGGPPPTIFDVEPIPQVAVTRIIETSQELRVSIRRPGTRSQLVRLGVSGQRGGEKPEADELVVVLGLVAHAPPRILWIGPGDEVRTDANGCVRERTVDFDMPFGERLEMATVQRAHARDPGSKQPCPAPPGTQQIVDYQPRPLPPGRPAVTRRQ
jgi:hypothetical protein